MGKVNINRPVHLALRDKNYEKFLELLKYSFDARSLDSRRQIVESLVERAQTAYDEGHFALRGVLGSQLERDFIKFLEMVLDALRAVQFMVEHEEILQRDTSFLRRFLREDPRAITDSKFSHRSRAAQILEEVKIMAGIAEKAYHKLREENLKSLNRDDKRRYAMMTEKAAV